MVQKKDVYQHAVSFPLSNRAVASFPFHITGHLACFKMTEFLLHAHARFAQKIHRMDVKKYELSLRSIQRPVVCICWTGAIVISSCTLICEKANPASPSSPPSSIFASRASRSLLSLSSLSSRSLSALRKGGMVHLSPVAAFHWFIDLPP